MKKISAQWFEQNERMYVKRINNTILYRFYEFLKSILGEISPGCSLEEAEAETPILWPPHAKSWLNGKDPDARRDLGQEKKGMTEDEMAGWHHRLDGHDFE